MPSLTDLVLATQAVVDSLQEALVGRRAALYYPAIRQPPYNLPASFAARITGVLAPDVLLCAVDRGGIVEEDVQVVVPNGVIRVDQLDAADPPIASLLHGESPYFAPFSPGMPAPPYSEASPETRLHRIVRVRYSNPWVARTWRRGVGYVDVPIAGLVRDAAVKAYRDLDAMVCVYVMATNKIEVVVDDRTSASLPRIEEWTTRVYTPAGSQP